MISKIRNFLRLLGSNQPRDRIRLQRRLGELAVIGPVWRRWERMRARILQHDANDYLEMQRRTFELMAGADEVKPGNIDGDYVAGSWRQHDAWEDYETYLMKSVPGGGSWIAIEYGCGPGRNIRRWTDRFARIDGVDIAQTNLDNASAFLEGQIASTKIPHLFLTEGRNCGDAPKSYYDFAFSTICLQHICVWEVRFDIFRSLFECLKPGGRLSIQMGFGKPSPDTVPYHCNHYEAHSTNRACDVEVADPKQIEEDLVKIGFECFEYWIRPVGPGDCHPNWIFFTATKPDR